MSSMINICVLLVSVCWYVLGYNAIVIGSRAAGYQCLEKTSVYSDVSTPLLWLNGPNSISFKAVGCDQTMGRDTQHFQDIISEGLHLPPGLLQRRVKLASAKIKGLIWSVSWHNMPQGTPYFGGGKAVPSKLGLLVLCHGRREVILHNVTSDCTGLLFGSTADLKSCWTKVCLGTTNPN